MPGVLLCCSACQTHTGAPLTGVLPCRSVHQTLKGIPWLGSYSVVWPKSHTGAPWVGSLLCGSVCHAFDGPAFLLLSCQCWRCWLVGKEAMVMAPPTMRDSALSPCFHGCLAFLHRHFPPQSPPSHPLNPSLQSTAALALGLLQLPASAPSRGSMALSGGCMAAARTV